MIILLVVRWISIFLLGAVLAIALFQTMNNLYDLVKNRRLDVSTEDSEVYYYIGNDNKRITRFLLGHLAATASSAALLTYLVVGF